MQENKIGQQGIPEASVDERYQAIYDNLDISTPKPLEGDWVDGVEQIPAGNVFFEQLREYVNLPIIIDGLNDDERRSWRKWAAEKGLNLDTYLSNKLKLNKLNTLHQAIDFLCPAPEYRDGSIPEEVIEELTPIKEMLEASMTLTPGEYQGKTIREITQETIQILLERQSDMVESLLKPLDISISVDNVDEIMNQLEQVARDNQMDTINPNGTGDELGEDRVIIAVREAILSFLKNQNENFDKKALRSVLTLLIRPKMSGERLYNTPEFNVEKKVKLAQELERRLRTFLEKYLTN